MTDSNLPTPGLDPMQANTAASTSAEGSLPDEELAQASEGIELVAKWGTFKLTDPCPYCGSTAGYYLSQMNPDVYRCNNSICDQPYTVSFR